MVKERLRQLMELRGMKVQQLAYHAGVSDASIYNILNDADPRLSTIARIARALGVELCELIDESQLGEFIESRDKLEALATVDA
jgi:transcriptional regulator with XRE-family HTH domain